MAGYFICAILHTWHLQRICRAVFNKLEKNDWKNTKLKLKNLFCKSWPDVEPTCDHMWDRRGANMWARRWSDKQSYIGSMWISDMGPRKWTSIDNLGPTWAQRIHAIGLFRLFRDIAAFKLGALQGGSQIAIPLMISFLWCWETSNDIPLSIADMICVPCYCTKFNMTSLLC